MKRKKVLALLMATAVTFGSAVPMSTLAMVDDQYSDVQKDDSFFEYVEDVTDYKIMAGLKNKSDEFGVAEKITRSDLVEYLYKMMLKPAANGSLRFEDVLDQDYEEAVVWADSVGLFDGLEDTFFENDKFAADTEVTREQAAVILHNLATKVLKIDFDSTDDADAIKDADGNVLKALESLDAYEDGADVDESYLEAVKWAVGYTLLNPATTDEKDDRYVEELAGKLNMQGTLEKVDLAEAISKLLNMVPKDSSVETAKTEYDEQQAAATDNTAGYVRPGTGSNFVKPTTTTANKNTAADTNKNGVVNSNTTNDTSDEADTTVTTPEQTPEQTPAPEAPHEHNWVKNEWGEKGHYDKDLVKDAWTETIDHEEEGHMENVMVSPEKSHVEEVVLVPEQGHREDVFHPEEGHYESVMVSPEEGHYENVLVSEEKGHYEDVMVSPEKGHYETVHHEEEGHYEDQEVSPEKGHYETVHHEEEGHYETVHHEEEGHWDTQQVQVGTQPIYETENHAICNTCGADICNTADADAQQKINEHVYYHADLGQSCSWRTENVQIQVGEEPVYEDQEVWVVDKEAWDEQVWVVDKEAYDEQVWVVDQEAVYDKVWVVDKEAYDEQVWVVDQEAQYEQQWVVDQEAVYEDQWVVDKEAVYEDQWVVDKEAWTEAVWVTDVEQVSDFVTIIDQEAVYEDQWVVDKEAWTETVEHPAEYEDVWVVDQEAGFNWVCSGCGEVKEEI